MRAAGFAGVMAVLAGALGLAAPAQAFDFRPVWGWATIADDPFNEPGSGALLATTQAFPRGQVKDAGTPDCCAVKLTVTAVGTAGQSLFSYETRDGAAVYRNLDRRLDTSPSAIAALRYDLCRSDGVCQSHTIARPAPPAPTPQPGTSPTPTPTPTPMEDRDGDGFPSSADCSDTNSTVFPGAREVPGNGIDDDCAAGDQPGKVVATVSSRWSVTKKTNPKVTRLWVRDAPVGAQIDVLCSGRGCPFKQRRTLVDANGEAALTKLFKRRLRAGITLDVQITAPNMIGKVTRYAIKHGDVPTWRSLCLPLGATKAQRRC